MESNSKTHIQAHSPEPTTQNAEMEIPRAIPIAKPTSSGTTPRTSESSQPPSITTPLPPPPATIVELNGDTAPIIYELKATKPTPREVIAKHMPSSDYNGLDEFSRREFIQQLELTISKRTREARPTDLYRVSEYVVLKEYDFEKKRFPLSYSADKSHIIRLGFLDGIPIHYLSSGYIVCPSNTKKLAGYMPVDLTEAQSLAPALRTSREATLSYVGTLDKCVEMVAKEGSSDEISFKVICLNVSEIRLTLNGSSQSVSWQLRKEEPSNAHAEPNNNEKLAKRSTSSIEEDTPPVAQPVIPVAKLVTRQTPTEDYVVAGLATDDFLNIRSAPAMSSLAVSKLTNGDQVHITGKSVFNGDTEWIPVTTGSKQGWVRNKYIQPKTR